MDFFKPKKNMQDKVRGYFSAQNYGICDFTLGSLYMWADFYNCHISFDNNALYTRIDNTDKPDSFIYTIPICSDILSGLDFLIDHVKASGEDKLILTSVTKPIVDLLSERFKDSCSVEFLRDSSDYIYSAEKLALLSGRSYNKKRNLVKQFEKLYPNYKFESVTKENKDNVISAFRSFRISNDSTMGGYDETHTERMIDEYFDYDLLSGVLTVDGNVVAFTMGEVIGDMLFIHIEKANIQYKGAYQMINMLFAKAVYESHKITLINRAEDLGEEGLRKSKESYHPLYLAEKYRIEIKL